MQRVREAGGRALKLYPAVAGIPDRLVLLPGGWLAFVEVKSTTGRLKPAQRRWRDVLQELGFRWYLVRDATGVEAVIKGYDCEERTHL